MFSKCTVCCICTNCVSRATSTQIKKNVTCPLVGPHSHRDFFFFNRKQLPFIDSSSVPAVYSVASVLMHAVVCDVPHSHGSTYKEPEAGVRSCLGAQRSQQVAEPRVRCGSGTLRTVSGLVSQGPRGPTPNLQPRED